MILDQYMVDSFTDKIFHGNPAAVCILDEKLPEQLLADIAGENGFCETAFAVKNNKGYNLRWFTPGGEIDLCGHATLAAAFVIMNYYSDDEAVHFDTLGGELVVRRMGKSFEMEFPAFPVKQVPVTDEMEAAIGIRPAEAWISRDLVCIMRNEEEVFNCVPDFIRTQNLPGLLLHITAKAMKFDYVIRSFAPKLGIYEDQVCGSGHCHMVPIWAERSKRTSFEAYQASKRGGKIDCRLENDKICLVGKAVLYAKSQIYI